MNKAFYATVKTVEDDYVVIAFQDGQMVRIPLFACEGSPKVGATVGIVLAALGSEDAGRQTLARALLNEILAS
jgi:hypothetical protein